MCETVRNDEFNYIVSKRMYNSYQMTSKLGVLMTTIQFLSLKKKKKKKRYQLLTALLKIHL